MIRSVAVLGAGRMGAAIACRIQEAGFALTVCDVNDEVLRRFERGGARVTRQAADCAAADLVIVLVATPEQTRAVVLGEQGLRSGLAPGRAPIVALMSTVPVETVDEVREALAGDVAGLVDAPISGGLSRAEQGTLAVMVGGEVATIEAVRPVLQTFAMSIIRCGALGAGQKVKIVNNIVGNANAIFTAEAYRLATEMGLTVEDTARALEVATGRNFFSAHPDDLCATYAALVRDRPSFDALLAIVRKDTGFAVKLASRSSARYPAIEGLKAILDDLGDETYDNWRCVAASARKKST